MSSLYLLIPIALVFVAIAVRILWWAINSGQYDNLDTEAHRILFDNDEKLTPATQNPVSAQLSADANPEQPQTLADDKPVSNESRHD